MCVCLCIFFVRSSLARHDVLGRFDRLMVFVKAPPFYFLAGAGGALTLLDNQARPSRRPSPVVAQLGTTYQTLSLSLESCRASVTSCGFMAVGESCLVSFHARFSGVTVAVKKGWCVPSCTYPRANLACWRKRATGYPSSPYH